MADQVDTGAGTVEQAPAAAPDAGGADSTPEWASRLSQGFEQFNSRLDQLETRLPEPAQEEEPEDPGIDYSALQRELDDTAFDETGGLTEQGQAQLVHELVRRELQAQRDADFARSEEQRRERELTDLETRYPALATDQGLVDTVLERAASLADTLRQPALASEPRIIELALLAMRGEQAAAAERPAADQQDVHLESAGSAGPADAPSGADEIGDAIVARVRGRQFRSSR